LNRITVIFTVFVSAILLVSIGSCVSTPKIEASVVSSSDPESFYVGVTYCGDSVSEAKELIDKVKSYTNLFVIQSGPLELQPDKISQIVDYAVDSNLHFIVYFGSQYWVFRDDWLETFDHRWDDYFLGVYFGDEPGGKMLDSGTFYRDSSKNSINKQVDGSVVIFVFSPGNTSISVTYQRNGTISVEKHEFGGPFLGNTTFATYFTNGTIKVEVREAFGPRVEVDNAGNIPYSYEELWELNPFKNYDETSAMFVDTLQSDLLEKTEGDRDYAYFTSDYALHWFDYLSGYDVILAQIGWNHTIEQDIALVRGAANLQNKDWGAIITWKYNQPPYLDSGEAIYEQLRTAYKTGAKYAVIFNYAENMTGPYGILQDEHFVALERFWTEVVQNPEVKQGSIVGEAILVLPKNYGWGMRSPDDTIWGLWDADEKSEQIWNLRSDLIQEYGFTLDIVYDDPSFPVEGKYAQIFYTTAEKAESFPSIWFVAAIGVGAIGGGAFLVYNLKSRKQLQGPSRHQG
jgi:hypothetical protein